MAHITMKVTEGTLTISEQKGWFSGKTTVQLKGADPNELQLFIEKMPAFIKGKTSRMVNVSLQHCYFADDWKRAVVHPLLKNMVFN